MKKLTLAFFGILHAGLCLSIVSVSHGSDYTFASPTHKVFLLITLWLGCILGGYTFVTMLGDVLVKLQQKYKK